MDKMREKPYIMHSLYKIYELANDKPLYLSIPNAQHDTYELFVGFADINSYSKEDDKKREIRRVPDILNKINDHAIYLICDLGQETIDDFASYNDNKVKLYTIIRNRIYKYLSTAYEYLQSRGINVKLPVNIIKQNDSETKLINWLETDDNKRIVGIKYKKLKAIYDEAIFSGTMIMPFIKTSPKSSKVKVRQRKPNGYTKLYLILTIGLSLLFGIGFAYLLVK